MVLVVSLTLASGLRCSDLTQGLCVLCWSGAEEGGGSVTYDLLRWLWGPVYLLEDQEAGNIWLPGPELWPADLLAHKASPSATGRGPEPPRACRQRLQTAMRQTGPNTNSHWRKGPLWSVEDSCWAGRGCQLCVAGEGAGRCCLHTGCCGPTGAWGTEY